MIRVWYYAKIFFLTLLIFFSLTAPLKAAEPEEKFIWVGRIGGPADGQFTEEEFQKLAKNFSIVVFSAAHGSPGGPGSSGDIQKYHEAARRLVSINPNIKVFPYFAAAIIPANLDSQYIAAGFKDKWYLRDQAGNKVTYRDKKLIHYVDLSNPDYRAWALNWLESWLKTAPYAGIAFDTVNLFETLDPGKVEVVGQEKVDAWNAGLKALIREAKTRFVGKIIIANGVYEKRSDKNLPQLRDADIVLNESFCVSGVRSLALKNKEGLIGDIQTAQFFNEHEKILLQKSNFREEDNIGTPEQRSYAGRFCYALFLMTYQPGMSYYKFGDGYHIVATADDPSNDLARNSLEIDLPLGTPVADTFTKRNDDLYIRRFTNGIVYLNLSDSALKAKLPADAILMNGGVEGKHYQRGQTVTIPSLDASFFLFQLPSPSPTPSSTPTPTPTLNPADLNADGKVDIFDYNLLVSDFGKTGSPGWLKADIDKNGKVNIFDYNILVENFGK